jgi:hypothetical protein
MPLSASGRITISALAASMAAALGAQPVSSGQLARQMIECAERVSFLSA